MFCVSVSGSCRTDGGASRQRIVRAVVQATDSVAVESRLIHFESGAEQKVGSTLFDGEATSERGLQTVCNQAVARDSCVLRKTVRLEA